MADALTNPLHNHQDCINEALSKAKRICQDTGAKLTPLRKQVLKLIWQNHKPLGAYTLIDMLAEAEQRRIAPPTVYRALEFLMELGLIHRINSLNAYIGCSNPQSHLDKTTACTNYFFTCNQCHNTQELVEPAIEKATAEAAANIHFTIQEQWLEVSGLCRECRSE